MIKNLGETEVPHAIKVQESTNEAFVDLILDSAYSKGLELGMWTETGLNLPKGKP